MTIIPAWLESAVAHFAALGPRLPHALLIHGPRGVGKRLLGRSLARNLLCETAADLRPSAAACGACAACVWFDQRSHPDYRRMTSEVIAAAEGQDADEEATDGVEADEGAPRSKKAPSKDIRVEQVRALNRFLSVGTHRGRARVILIYPLEAINDIAANALLKMLEEPPPRTIFILVADHLGRVPATIVSRCQRVPVALPPPEDAAAWLAGQGVEEPEEALALAGGAPMAALEIARDQEARVEHRELLAFLARPTVESAFALAETFARAAPASIVRSMQLWVADCVSMRLSGRLRYHPRRAAEVAKLAAPVRISALVEFAQRLTALRRTIDHPLNTRLTLEGLFSAYADVMTPVRAAA